MVSIICYSVWSVYVINVEGIINKYKYIGILENKLWFVIVCYLFS